MSYTSFYDVIVVGTDLGGLLAAGLLRRRKYRVLVIGQGGLKTRYEYHGFITPALPLMLPAYGRASLLDEVLATLAIEDPLHRLGGPADTHVQVITPRERIDLWQDSRELEKELDRAVPDEKQAILHQLNLWLSCNKQLQQVFADRFVLPPETLRERARIKHLLKKSEESQLSDSGTWSPLVRILAYAATFISHLDLDTRSYACTGRLVLTMLDGMRSVPNLRELVVESIERTGVDVELNSIAEEILVDGKNITGVRLGENARISHCDVLLAALPLADAIDLVPLKRRDKAIRLVADSIRPRNSVFTFNLVLPSNAIPVGMGNHVLQVSNPTQALEQDNLIRMQCIPCMGRTDKLQLNVSCLVPYKKRNLGREYLGLLQQRMMRTISNVIPFIDDHVQALSSPFWNARADDPSQPLPWLMHRTFETDQPLSFGIALMPTQCAFRNMLLCGPEVLPGLGVEGEARTAMQAVRWCEENLKIKKVL